ncbi:hypothetical protein [Bifidobacterium sp. 7101]|uniref:hypothetical protein n=1 Tax=Bifidobacterium sp. 7101 TaxID=1394175 RepID=UPI00155B2F8C|nr:hypothetical protein [Bifidobacterium sp. 7101]
MCRMRAGTGWAVSRGQQIHFVASLQVSWIIGQADGHRGGPGRLCRSVADHGRGQRLPCVKTDHQPPPTYLSKRRDQAGQQFPAMQDSRFNHARLDG